MERPRVSTMSVMVIAGLVLACQVILALVVLRMSSSHRRDFDASRQPIHGDVARVIVDGKEVFVPRSADVELEVTSKTTDVGGSATGLLESSAKSLGLQTSSAEAAQKFETGNTTATNTGAMGSGAKYSGELLGQQFNIFYAFAAASMLVAIVIFMVTKDLKRAGIVAASSLVFVGIGVTVDQYPIVWVIGLVVLVGTGIWWAIDARRARETAEGLNVMVKAIKESPAAAKEVVKGKVAEVAASRGSRNLVDRLVDRAKAATGPTTTS